MSDCFVGEGAAPVRFFHICTDGTNNGIVHLDDADYRRAVSISAVNSEKCGVGILCFCHMSSHSHFVVFAESIDAVREFGESYKHDYARYVSARHGLRRPLSGVRCGIKEIGDSLYLRRCISYVLLNPVAAKVVRNPEEYRWSSFRAYFNPADDGAVCVSELGIRKCRELMHIRKSLKKSGLRLDSEGNVSLKSFVNHRFVERLFGSQTSMFKSLALTNYVTEEELYVDHCVKYDDTELIAEVMALSVRKFNKTEFRQLRKAEKYALIPTIVRKTGVTPKRLARILRVSPDEVFALLGSDGSAGGRQDSGHPTGNYVDVHGARSQVVDGQKVPRQERG